MSSSFKALKQGNRAKEYMVPVAISVKIPDKGKLKTLLSNKYAKGKTKKPIKEENIIKITTPPSLKYLLIKYLSRKQVVPQRNEAVIVKNPVHYFFLSTK